MTIGVTGHRVLAEPDRVRRGIDEALDAIIEKFGDDAVTLVTPLAEGADRFVAARVLARPRASLVVPLPLSREEYLNDFGTADSKAEFSRLLAEARQVVTLPDAPTRAAAYDAVGRYVLDHCDVLIAVWDGRPGNGTGNVVEEARRRKKPVAWVHAGNVDPDTKVPTSLGVDQGVVTFEGFEAVGASDHPRKPRLVLHVGVTGHRQNDLVGRDTKAIGETVGRLLVQLRDIVAAVHREHISQFDARPPLLRVFSRLADGSDLMVAEIAVEQGHQLHAPLPFARHEYEACIAPDWRSRYEAMLEAASGILELDGELRVGGRAHVLDEVFFESRRMVLRHSDVLIAIWDPEERPSRVWGTTRLVEEARHDDLLVVHIDPRKPSEYHLDVREEDADIHQVPAEKLGERIRCLVAPSPGCTSPYEEFLSERERRWTLGFAWLLFRNMVLHGWPGKPRLRVAGARERVREDATKLWQAVPPLPDEVRHAVDDVLVTPFTWSDTLAEHHAHLTRSSIVLNYLMAAGAVAMALTGYALGWTDEHHPRHVWAATWIAIEMALIVTIVANTWVGNAQRWHERWMDYRLLAERLRLQRILAPLGRITPDTRRPAHLSFGDLRGTWVGWYFRALVREVGMIPGRYDAGYVEAARAVMKTLLADGENGQIGWHERNARQCHSVDHRLHRLGVGLFTATGIACVVHLFVHWPWLTFLAATCPALGAAMAAIGMHLQLDRIAKHSTAMADRLARLRDYLERQPLKSPSVARPCEEIAACMTTEVLDWRSLFRGKITLPG